MNAVLLETVAIGIGTYLFRAGSLTLGSRLNWPAWIRRWLSFVTPAVLGALLGPELFLPSGSAWTGVTHNPALVAAIPTVWVALKTKNLLYTVATGVVAFAVASHFMS